MSITAEVPVATMSSPPRLDHAVAKPTTWQAGTLTYDKRGLARLFSWLLWGDFAWMMRDRSVTDVVRLLLIKYDASNTIISLLLVTIPGVMSMLMGPIVSYKSDRCRTRWGRRRPFLLVGVPTAALGMIAMAFSPQMGTWLHHALGERAPSLNVCVLIVFGVCWVIFEAAAILGGAVFNAFFNDVVPRPVMGRFFGLARVVSLGAGILFMGGVFGNASEHFTAIFIGIGLLYGVGFMSTVLMVKEGEYPPPPQTHGHSSPARAAVSAALSYFRECFGKPYYLLLFVAMTLAPLAFSPIFTFNVNFAKSLGISDGYYGRLTAVYFAVSLLLALPIGWLADKFHPLQLVMVVMLMHAVAAIWGGLFITDSKSFTICFMLTGILQGAYYTGGATLGPLLLPKSTFAQYASALGLLSMLVGNIFVPLVGWMLDLSHNSYRYTYLLAGVMDVAALLVLVALYVRFRALGGPKGYVAPE